MPKKYLVLLVGAALTAVAGVAATIVVRRSRTEFPPVAATVPRIETLPSTDGDAPVTVEQTSEDPPEAS